MRIKSLQHLLLLLFLMQFFILQNICATPSSLAKPILIDSPKVLVVLLEIQHEKNQFQVLQCHTKIVNGSRKTGYIAERNNPNESVFLLELVDNQQKIVFTQSLNLSFFETLEYVNNLGVLEKKQTEKKAVISLLQLPYEKNYSTLQISSVNNADHKKIIYQTVITPID